MTDIISSLQNAKVKLANSLQLRPRARRKERKIVLEGTRLVGDAVKQGIKPLYVLYEPNSVDYHLIADIQNLHGVELLQVTDDVMRHVSDTQQPQGIVAVFPLPMPSLPRTPERVVIADAIRDPGNMGTIMRTAAAAGAQVILLSPDCVDPYNPKVLRAGMGAHFRLPVIEAAWAEIAAYIEDTDCYLATGDGDTPYYTVDWTRRWALVIGNEAHGISKSAEALEATHIVIPMAAETESINAAAASAVILFEAQRQRLITP